MNYVNYKLPCSSLTFDEVDDKPLPEVFCGRKKQEQISNPAKLLF